MKIVNFEKTHIADARALALANYREERQSVGVLPDMNQVPDLTYFAENGLGVAAFEGEKMVGFLLCCSPWEHAFGSAARGTFSPIHAHGAAGENRAMIYRRLYQAAAEKWVANGITYHAIALYAHDRQALDAFFLYGFGVRCVDAIRAMDGIAHVPLHGFVFRELPKAEITKIRQLRRLLSGHLGESPCFMHSGEQALEDWLLRAEKRDSRVYVAEKQDEPVAFVEIGGDGENFISAAPGTQNICGACCLPQYRGTGFFANLLHYAIDRLKAQGVARLGVDYESFNPTAWGAWGKYFTPYTHSVVRRIDECALERHTSPDKKGNLG